MKKIVFVLAFAAIATLSFVTVNSVNATPVVIENTDEDPKKDEKKAEAKDADCKDAESTEAKTSCSAKKKSACCSKK